VQTTPGNGSAFFFQDFPTFPANTSYTVSAWVYPVSGDQTFELGIGWDHGSGSSLGVMAVTFTPTGTLWGPNPSTNQTAPAAAPNHWHQVVLLVDAQAETLTFELDGKNEGTTSTGALPPQADASIIVGQPTGGGGAVPGHFYYDDLSLTLGAVALQGPLHWWKGDGNANDSVGSANGTLIDGSYAPGENGQAFKLDGVDDYVKIPSSAMSGITGAISVSAWIKPATLSVNQVLVTQYDTHDTATSFDLALLAGGDIQWFVVGPSCDSLRGGARTVKTTAAIPVNQWTQVTGTFDPTTQQLQVFFNGQAVATTLTDSATVSSLCVASTPVTIGGGAEAIDGTLAAFFNGLIEDVQLYNADIRQRGPLVRGETTSGGISGDHPSTCNGCPVNTATGEFHQSFTDLSVPGRGMALDLTRTYSTNLAAVDSPVGFGWTDSYNVSLSIDAGDATVHMANGAEVTYVPNGSGGYNGPSSDFATLVKNGDGTYTYARDTGESYVFNPAGQLIKEVDRNGYVTTLTYSGGNLTTVSDPAGRRLSFTYGSNGKIASVTGPLGRTVSYSYDSAGDLIGITNVGGRKWSFTYGSKHRMQTMTDPRGEKSKIAYDSSGRVRSWTDPMKRVTTFSYADNANGSETTTETDPKGNVTTWDYQNLELTSVTRGTGTPEAATTSYGYDPLTLGLTSVTDPDGHTTTSTYDSQGTMLSSTDPLGHTTTYTYNSFNEVTSVTDALGVATTNTYDADGNLTSTSTPIGSGTTTTTYAYGNPARPGDVTAMTDPDGRTWTYTYDKYGDHRTTTDPLGDKTTYAYDLLGERTAVTTPRGDKTRYTYNVFGDVETITDPLGAKTAYSYDADQNLIKTTDANGHTTLYTYDNDNEQTSATTKNSSGATITKQSTTYDADGDVTTQVNGLGRKTTYTYDPLGREASLTDPLGRTTTYGYDLAGNRTSLTDAKGRTTTYAYDAGNELTSVTYSDVTTPNVSFTYDADGRRASMTDGTGTTTYAYDALGRLSKDVQGGGAHVSYGYDLAGNLAKITYPNGKAVTRAYDAAGRLASVTDWLGHKTAFTYDRDSNLVAETYPNGVVASFIYDATGRLTHIMDAHGTKTLLDLAYKRDKLGLVTAENTTSYGYDGATRLTSSTVGPSPIAYDVASQLTALGSTILDYNTGGELTSLTKSSGKTAFAYDKEGDRISMTPASGSVTAYGYDQAGRLVSYTHGSTTASYAYNGDGLRMSKTVDKKTSSFCWDLADGLPLILSSGSTYYVTGPGGLPLEQLSGTTVLYYSADQLGSTRLLTKASGAVAASFTYDPYGTLAKHTGTAKTAFGFAGQYTDWESGLVYLRARYYDPSTAQFLTVDPANDLTGQPYEYATANPVNATDPAGMDDCGWNPACYAAEAASAAAAAAASAWNATGGKAVGAVQGFFQQDPRCPASVQPLGGWQCSAAVGVVRAATNPTVHAWSGHIAAFCALLSETGAGLICAAWATAINVFGDVLCKSEPNGTIDEGVGLVGILKSFWKQIAIEGAEAS
jgi:RHS repeat-associated protein